MQKSLDKSRDFCDVKCGQKRCLCVFLYLNPYIIWMLFRPKGEKLHQHLFTIHFYLLPNRQVSTAEWKVKSEKVKSTSFCRNLSIFGATGQIRTGDLLITNQLLYRLSHSSTFQRVIFYHVIRISSSVLTAVDKEFRPWSTSAVRSGPWGAGSKRKEHEAHETAANFCGRNRGSFLSRAPGNTSRPKDSC